MESIKVTEAIFRLSRMCILSTSFSGTGSELSRYARRPVGWRRDKDKEQERKRERRRADRNKER